MKNILFAFLLTGFGLFSFGQSEAKLTIYFPFNGFTIDSKAKCSIDSLLKTTTFVAFRIEAHCDSIGNHAYNDKLSMQRATSVQSYLSANNVPDSIIRVKALGKRFPVANNETEQARALNRCVDVYCTPAPKPVKRTIPKPENDSTLKISNLKVGETLRLENINFEGGRHILIPSSIPTLQKLLKTMKEYPTLEIEIHGYICCEISGRDGMDFDTRTNDLSVNRAQVVYNYLVERGIAASRLSYKGFGSNNKLVEERTEADRTTNRRVEIKIVKK